MKINLQSVKQLSIMGLASLLISCGGGDTNTPARAAPVPIGTLSGVVMLGPVEDATITVYEIDDTDGSRKPTPLGEKVSASNRKGEYDIDLQLNVGKTPILVCATLGFYDEPASIAAVPLSKKDFNNDELCAISVYEKGEKIEVNITFFTHLAYAEMRYNMSHKGAVLMDVIETTPATKTSPEQVRVVPGVLSNANSNVSDWIDQSGGFDIVTVKPRNIKDPTNRGSFTSEFKYGLANMALSSIVDWTSAKGAREGEFIGASSIAFAQKAYDDIKSDGILDGKFGGSQMKYLETDLSPHIYRHHYALRMFAVVANDELNQTAIKPAEVKLFAQHMGTHTETVFNPNLRAEPLDTEKPVIGHAAGVKQGVLVKGVHEISFTVTDPAGLETVQLTFTDKVTGASVVGWTGKDYNVTLSKLNQSLYIWEIDSNTDLDDGTYSVSVYAKNRVGAENTRTYQGFQVSNTGVDIIFKSPGAPLPNSLNQDNAFSGIAGLTQTVEFKIEVSDPFALTTDPAADPTKLLTVVTMEVLKADGTTSLAPANIATLVPGALIGGTKGARIYSHLLDISASKLADGQYQMKATVTSNPAGATPIIKSSLKAFAVDNTIPTAKITSPLSFAVVLSNTTPVVNISGTVEDIASPTAVANYSSKMGLSKIDVDTNEKKNIPLTDKLVSISLSGPELGAQGWRDVVISAQDIAGNHIHTPIVKIGYDITKPTISFDAATDQYTNSWVKNLTGLSFGITAGDKQTGIESVDVSLGLNAGGSPVTVKSYTDHAIIDRVFSHTGSQAVLGATPDGVYTYKVIAKDYGGNTFEKVVTPIGLDTLAPTVTAVSLPKTSVDPLLINIPTLQALTDTVNVNIAYKFKLSDPGYVGGFVGSGSGVASYSITGAVKTPGSKNGTAIPAGETIPDDVMMAVGVPYNTYKLDGHFTRAFNVSAACSARDQKSVTFKTECETKHQDAVCKQDVVGLNAGISSISTGVATTDTLGRGYIGSCTLVKSFSYRTGVNQNGVAYPTPKRASCGATIGGVSFSTRIPDSPLIATGSSTPIGESCYCNAGYVLNVAKTACVTPTAISTVCNTTTTGTKNNLCKVVLPAGDSRNAVSSVCSSGWALYTGSPTTSCKTLATTVPMAAATAYVAPIEATPTYTWSSGTADAFVPETTAAGATGYSFKTGTPSKSLGQRHVEATDRATNTSTKATKLCSKALGTNSGSDNTDTVYTTFINSRTLIDKQNDSPSRYPTFKQGETPPTNCAVLPSLGSVNCVKVGTYISGGYKIYPKQVFSFTTEINDVGACI